MPKDKLVAYSENGLKQVHQSIEVVRVDLGASGAMLEDHSGRLLVECGSHGDIDVDAFLALLGNAMSASGAVMQLLRDVSAFDLHVHEGTNYEIYTTRITDQVFLTLVFGKKEGAGRVGMVWLTLRRAVPELRTLLRRAVVKSGTSAERENRGESSATLSEAPNFWEAGPLKENPPSPRGRAKEPRKKSAAPEPAAGETDDPDRTISYDEARRLGLVNLDDESK